MGAQRRTRIRAVLSDKIVATEDLARVEAQCATLLTEQRRRENDLVEQVPSPFETQRALTRCQHIPPRIIEVALSYLTDFTLRTQTFCHRGILRIIVHIAHDQKLLVGICLQQRVFHNLQLSTTLFTVIRSSTARRQMIHDNCHMLTGQYTTHHQETSCIPQRVLRLLIYIRYELHVTNREECGVIDQAAVDAALVRSFHMDILDIALFQGWFIAEIGQTLGILHLSHTDGCTTFWQTVGSHLREHAGEVMKLIGVFLGIPLKRTFWHKFIVVLTFIMTGIKEILEIIEADGIIAAFQGFTRYTGHGDQ